MTFLQINTFYKFTKKPENGKSIECEAKIIKISHTSVSMQFYKDTNESDGEETIRTMPLSWITNVRPNIEEEITRELRSIFCNIQTQPMIV